MSQNNNNLVPPNSFDRPGELYQQTLAQADLQKKSPVAIPDEADVLEPTPKEGQKAGAQGSPAGGAPAGGAGGAPAGQI